MAIKLAGMVTLYKPSEDNISNIKNYMYLIIQIILIIVICFLKTIK